MPGVGYSHQFQVEKDVYRPMADAALKSFYYIRASTSLPFSYAGLWSWPISHPDKLVYVHPSEASPERPDGTAIASSKGWYDAGFSE